MKKDIKVYRDILNSIEMNYKVADNQTNLYTPHHIKYEVTLTRYGRSINITYQLNKQYTTVSKEKCISALFVEDEHNSLLKMILNDDEIKLLKSIMAWA